MMDIEVTRGVTFRDYSHTTPSGKLAEVSFEDGVVHAEIPIEIGGPEEARSWASLLNAAALEAEQSGR